MEQDRVERTVHIAATAEHVWDILTKPEHIGRWFGRGTPATVDLRPDGVMAFEPGPPGERYLARVVKVDPPRYLAYRWASAYPGVLADDTNSTLVEFHVSADGEKTRLTVCESGFASLTIPAGREPFASYENHSQGWTEIMAGFVEYVGHGAS
jgi:uncharacterized protein YndB with AHSA1/START domain